MVDLVVPGVSKNGDDPPKKPVDQRVMHFINQVLPKFRN